MKTLFTAILLPMLLSINAQDYIRTDFPLEISNIQMADMIFSPDGETLLRSDFEIVPLSPGFVPASDAVDLRPDYIGAYIQGCSYFAENEMAVMWNHTKKSGGEFYGYLLMQIFDTLGGPLTPEIAVDSVKGGGYIFINMAASPDSENDIGIAWTSADTLFSVYFNAATRLLSDKQKLLTGITEYHVQMADFMLNGDVRIIWRDNDNYVRHKRLSKTGTVVNEEAVIFGPLNNFMFAKYASNKNGDFLLAEFHRPPATTDYGIETRKYNSSGVAMGNSLWVSDSVPISLSDLVTRYVSISMQDDGKSVVVWSPYGYDVANQRVVKFLQMQFMGENGSRIGEPFKPVKVNTESYNKGYEIAEQYPFVWLTNDTVLLHWSNYNEELSPVYAQLYMNIQKLVVPVVSAIPDLSATDLKHWYTRNSETGECKLMIESASFQHARIEILDILGKPAVIFNTTLFSGQNDVLLDKNNFQNISNRGFYIYRIETAGNYYTGKIYW